MSDGDLRKLFRQHLVEFDWCTVESGATGGGIPDSNFCTLDPVALKHRKERIGIEGWLEYKQTPGWTVTLRSEQVGWIARRVRYGGRVWIAVRQRARGLRTGDRDALWLVRGEHARAARETGLRGLESAGLVAGCWHGGPARWDWRQVGATLAG